MKKIAMLATALSALWTLPAVAQSIGGQDAVPSLLTAMRQAAGGRRWDEVRSLHMTGAVVEGGQSAAFERWEDVVPGRYRERSRWPTFTAEDGFDGVTPWRERRSGIAYALGDLDAQRVAADEAYRVSRAWWFPERHAGVVALVGQRREDGRDYDVIEIGPEGGRPFRAWVDHDTHLLWRTEEQQAEDFVVTTYRDYRSVDGLVLPFRINSGDGKDPSGDEAETIDAVQVDAPAPDGSYSMPPQPAPDIELPPGRDSVDVPFRLTATNRILVPLRVDDGPPLEAEFDSGGSLILQPATAAALQRGAAASPAVARAPRPQAAGGCSASPSAAR